MPPFDFEFACQEWEPIVRQAAMQQSARGLTRLDCWSGDFGPGKFVLMRRDHRTSSGVLDCRLYFNARLQTRMIFIGRFSQPIADAVIKRRGYGNVWQSRVVDGKVIQLECGRTVKVKKDSLGLPYPVPIFDS